MKIVRKKIENIRRGDIVVGSDSGWWRVERVEREEFAPDTVYLRCRHTTTNKPGELSGVRGTYREVVKP